MYDVSIINELLGKILTDIQLTDDEIIFSTSDGRRYMMYHCQDCCESVYVEDIIGDINDLIGSELVEAEEVSFRDKKDLPDEEKIWMTLSGDDLVGGDESNTWTFYKFRTSKGSVTIRWIGSSNGYYSESVSIEEIK